MPAKVHIALVKTGFIDGLSQPVSSVSSVPETSITATSSASSAVIPDLVGPAKDVRAGYLWLITVSGGDIDIAFDPDTPDAAGGATHRVLAGYTRDFVPLAGLEKVAIKDVA